MNCPRCGESLSVYRLGEAETASCEACAFVGIEVEHQRDQPRTESWEDALTRFRRLHSGDGSPSVGDPPHEESQAERIEAMIATLDLPGSDEVVPRRRAAIQCVYDRLVSRGSARRAELLEVVRPDELGYATAESFWNHGGRSALATLPGVEPPGDGDQKWRYRPPTDEPSPATRGRE